MINDKKTRDKFGDHLDSPYLSKDLAAAVLVVWTLAIVAVVFWPFA